MRVMEVQKLNSFFIARVAELVYAHDLKSCLARDVGSIPTSGTGKFFKFFCLNFMRP